MISEGILLLSFVRMSPLLGKLLLEYTLAEFKLESFLWICKM